MFSGLNKNGPQRFIHLNEIITRECDCLKGLEKLGGVALSEEECYRGWALRFQ